MNLIFLLLGVVLGWFFLPTPAFAKTALNWLVQKLPFLANFVKKD